MNDPGILGALIEQQVESLEQRGVGDSTQRTIKALLESALKVYDEAQNPVRRARVILRLLEVLYRGNDIPSFDYIRALAEEVETLLSTEVGGSRLSYYKVVNPLTQPTNRPRTQTSNSHHIKHNTVLSVTFG